MAITEIQCSSMSLLSPPPSMTLNLLSVRTMHPAQTETLIVSPLFLQVLAVLSANQQLQF